jgi:hypothetical protein
MHQQQRISLPGDQVVRAQVCRHDLRPLNWRIDSIDRPIQR